MGVQGGKGGQFGVDVAKADETSLMTCGPVFEGLFGGWARFHLTLH